MKNFLPTVLKAGLLVGTLDIIAASIHYYIKTNNNPLPMLRGIASGVFGAEAIKGGIGMSLMGLLFHFIIAMSFTFFFFFLAKQIPAILKIPLMTGIIYGVFAWAVMRFIIIPYFSRINPRPVVFKDAAIASGILMICIGIPLAFWAKNYFKKNYSTNT